MALTKKMGHASLKGKKPDNTSKVKRTVTNNPGRIKNKLKRSEMYGKYLLEKKARKRQTRIQREKEAEALGDDAEIRKQVTRTLDNTRETEVTTVQPDDDEILADEAEDEFAPYFSDEIRPKILLTTRPCPSAELFHFISDLMRFFPQLYYYPRKSFSVKEICTFGSNRKFTHLIVLSEKKKSVQWDVDFSLASINCCKWTRGPHCIFQSEQCHPLVRCTKQWITY
mmetsp:Transcript_1578/g.3357  ORF Transcript_1578/g.3357 Transcript_1578/m.3357 type:complete len:226 (+) Transcript_1578:190-867(+)